MRKISVSLLLSLIVFLNLTVSVFATSSKDIEGDINEISVNAQSAILMDFETGRVLWEKNSKDPLAMASTTKIMTAIVALENAKLNEKVIVSAKAAAAPKVKMNLKKGEEISMEALLYALMMQSSNDAAVAIAENVGGSVENFCNMMTAKAKELGANDTIFETPNGLDKGEHHSTAYDLAIITRYALNNKKFMQIINTKNITISSNNTTYDIANKNRLLSEFSGATGVKTGYTGKAGQCFVGSAKRGDMQLISVVLASGWGDKGKEQKWIDSKRILDFGFRSFEYKDVIEENEFAISTNVSRAKENELDTYYSKSIKIPVLKSNADKITVKINVPISLKAPIVKDEKIGTATILVNDEIYDEVDILSNNNISRFDLKTCFETVVDDFLGLGTKSEIKIILPETPFEINTNTR